MKRYPAYKDSGVEWTGAIPEHWDVLKLKHLAKIRLSNVDKKVHEGEEPVHLCNYTDVYYNEYILPGLNFMDATASKEQIQRFNLEAGDVLITKDSETPDDIAVPAYVPERLENVVCGYHLALIKPDPKLANGEFLFRSFLSPPINAQFSVSANGITRFGVGRQEINSAFFPVPSIPEQKCIGKYLRNKTQLIDTLIAKKKRQIELLQEQRAAIINQAVTKGLDPNVPMKDSGVPWLGAIPRSWEVKRLKYLLTSPLRYGANESAEHDDPSWPRYVRITDINEDGDLRQETFKSLPEEIARPYLLKQGDLLFARSGATVGKTFLYKESWGTAAYAGYLILARFDTRRVVPSFVAYFCRSNSYWSWLGSTFIQATIQNVSAERYANLGCPLPRLKEQQEIVKQIDGDVTAIGSAIMKFKNSITKLQEYRTTLISEVVTGKIDVREEVTADDTAGPAH